MTIIKLNTFLALAAISAMSLLISKPLSAQDVMKYDLTVNILNMGPHVYQLFEMRVIDMADGEVVGYFSKDPLGATDQTVDLGAILVAGHSYQVDAYGDNNNSKAYETLPLDHAWRTLTGEITGDTVVEINHMDNWVDIEFNDDFTTVYGCGGCDVNDDGKRNVIDAISLLLLINNGQIDACDDYDGNGEANVTDVIALLLDIRNGTCE